MEVLSIAQFLKTSLRTPKTQLGILLTAIFVTAFIEAPSPTLIITYALSLLGTVVPDLLFLKVRKIPLYFPSAALVTGTIIALVLAPNPPWYQPLIVGTLAIASKHLLRFGRPLFNPAAFGLLAGALLFNTPISWWGVSFQRFTIYDLRFTIYFLILLSLTLISGYRLRRYSMILSFLVLYSILNYLVLPIQSDFFLLRLVADPTVLFFSLVMLPEPMTSPSRPLRQIFFGIFIAAFSILFSVPIFNFQFSIFNSIDPLIGALLIGNLAFFRFR